VNKICNELQTFLSLGKTMDWIAEHYSIDMQLAWAIRLWEKSDKERAKALKIDIKKYSTWNYTSAHPLMGSNSFKGRIPGEIPFNIIHWFSKPGDLVVDPMAGSGTTLDAALLLNRKCRGHGFCLHKCGQFVHTYSVDDCEDRI
jgi:DNA modification methylase